MITDPFVLSGFFFVYSVLNTDTPAFQNHLINRSFKGIIHPPEGQMKALLNGRRQCLPGLAEKCFLTTCLTTLGTGARGSSGYKTVKE